MIDKTKDAISEFLNTDFIPEEQENLPEIAEEKKTEIVVAEPTAGQSHHAKQAEEDFQLAREATRQIVTDASIALDRMTALAAQMDSASFFEAYGKFIKNYSDVTKDLIELHQKKDALVAFVEGGESEGSGLSNINIENAIVYSGTTADLQRRLKPQEVPEEYKE